MHVAKNRAKPATGIISYLRRNWTLYSMVLPGFLLLFIFCYIPMYGIIMAFQNFRPALGYFASPIATPWYKHFAMLFQSALFGKLFKNTLVLGVLSLLWSFPAPIILALLFNEVKWRPLKRMAQTISYMPYFLSTIIVIGILRIFLATTGPVNQVLGRYGITMNNQFMNPDAFYTFYIGTGLWTGIGFSSIIYLAAIAGINPEFYEAALMDGATRFQRIRYITLPSLMPTATILLIFSISGIVGNDFQKILLIYNEATYKTADVIQTYVYRVGVRGTAHSFSAAAGLFSSVLSCLLLFAANFFARKVGETSLW